MEVTLWLNGAAIVGLLALSFFFSGSETALTASSRARLLQLEKSGDRRATVVSSLLHARERLIGTLLLGNTIVNILASALTTSLFLQLFGEKGVGLATLILTVVVVIFSEVLPKTWAITAPESFALVVARPIRPLVKIVGPIMAAVELLVRGILRLFGVSVDASRSGLTPHDEIRGAVDLQHLEGGLVKVERDRLGGVLDLGELCVSDVMIHRTAMQMLNGAAPPVSIIEDVLASSHTRLPVWRGAPENIIGVLHARDLLRAVQAAGGDIDQIDITKVMRPPWFVPDTTGLNDQLSAFLKRHNHFALVVDEYGEVMGLVTLEDILEEIVGEIADEHDVEVAGVRPQPDGSIIVEGTVPVRDLNRALDLALPDDVATTIAGLVIHAARIIPAERQIFTFYGKRFQVMRRDRNRIALLRISRVDNTPVSPKHVPEAPKPAA
ncbi:HlyC/CorC family transporter [Segnochrobactraceae bacterium EtOH-i3]